MHGIDPLIYIVSPPTLCNGNDEDSCTRNQCQLIDIDDLPSPSIGSHYDGGAWLDGTSNVETERPCPYPIQQLHTFGHKGRRCRGIREVIRQKEGRKGMTCCCAEFGLVPKNRNRPHRAVPPEVRVTDEDSEQSRKSAATCGYQHHNYAVVHLTHILSSSARACWLSIVTSRKYSRTTVLVSEF